MPKLTFQMLKEEEDTLMMLQLISGFQKLLSDYEYDRLSVIYD